MVCGMFVWCSVCVCMLTALKALLMSCATVIVRSGGLFWLLKACCDGVVYVV